MASTDVSDRVEPALRENDVASGTLHGFDDQGGNLVHSALDDRRLERLGGDHAPLRFGQPRGASIAVGRGSLAEGRPPLRAGHPLAKCGQAPESARREPETMVGAVKRNHLCLAGHSHSELDCGLDTISATGAEDRLIESTRADLGQLGGEVHHRRRVVHVEMIGDQLELRSDCLPHSGMAVADERGAVGPRDSVEVLAAVYVPDPRSTGAVEDQATIAATPLDGVEHVPIGGLAQLLGAVHESLGNRARAAARPRRMNTAGPKRASAARLFDR